jgi:hypothetical protein
VPIFLAYEVVDRPLYGLTVFAGAGPMYARWDANGLRSRVASRIHAQAGIENALKVARNVELSGRVVGRLAQANHVPQDGGGFEAITDLTGVNFTLGLRVDSGR